MSRRITWSFIMVLLIAVLAFLAVACTKGIGESAAPSSLDGKTLVQERCTQCHDLARVEAARKTREEWQSTVDRMVSKGARLNQAEEEAVVQYLSETYPK
jgi:hypothetical protein